jgi:hypothetical protein
LERLRPGLPVLYLVGAGKTIARCSIEAQAPGSVLAIPFTQEQLLARVGDLLEAAARHPNGEQLWKRLVAVSDWLPEPTAMLHVYETHQAELAASHVALLSAGDIEHAFRPTNSKARPYGISVRARDVAVARRLTEQVSAARPSIVAA